MRDWVSWWRVGGVAILRGYLLFKDGMGVLIVDFRGCTVV